ncbi:Glu/Leu/Phe/Val dehydrogenase [Shimia biformata]|uniref:Glu/Leu/Phe/Val dehydrogenase n=1 Tax=Shimia biformata TaxID=1294299 RepID=UPI00194FB901|nr:Glu/Leu/Phe/Val dehydrogenase [Shimia biformata]
MSVFDHIEYDGHLRITHVTDADTGLRAVHAVHRTVNGMSGGGIRFRPYASDDEALTDVLRLSKAMSQKFALAGIPVGGGKSVIIGDPAQLKTPALLAAYGRYIEGLNGLYVGGPDVGTNAEDMTELARSTRYVTGRADQSGSTALPTALGCMAAMKATVQAAFDREGFDGLRVAVQGAGGVGGELVKMLIRDGATVLVADIDQAALANARAAGATVVSTEDILTADVDLLSPNAMGAVLSPETIPTIQAQAICGCANNQLATPDCADLLTARGILWAPDYVVSAGGAIDGCKDAGLITPEERDAKIDGIGETLAAIFAIATQDNMTTDAAAQLLAQRRMSENA